MYQISINELETIVNRYIKQYGPRPSIGVIKQIIDALEYNYRKYQNPNFHGEILKIQVDFEKLTDTLCQYTIYATFRDDTVFKKSEHLTELEKNIMGLKIHSHVIYSLLHPNMRKFLDMLSTTTKITYSNDKIIINNCHILVPAMIVYNLLNCNDMTFIYFCHINNEQLFDNDFKTYYHQYLQAYTNFKDKLNEQKQNDFLNFPKNTEANKVNSETKDKLNIIFDPSNINLTEEETKKVAQMTKQQKTDYLYRKFLINNKLKKPSNLFQVKHKTISEPNNSSESSPKTISSEPTKQINESKCNTTTKQDCAKPVNYGSIYDYFIDMSIDLDFDSVSCFGSKKKSKHHNTKSANAPLKPDHNEYSKFVGADGKISYSAMSEYY
jgi:hypothetical protein